MRLNASKIERIVAASRETSFRAFAENRSISNVWLSLAYTDAKKGHDFSLGRARRLATALGVDLEEIVLDDHPAPVKTHVG